METFDLYRDIAKRTDGHIYLGLVGPVRTGKSTFIKRFMEQCVLPHIADEPLRERMQDELPQSGSGRTIMTTQPNFVPEKAAEIAIGDARAQVRLIDCVGYLARGALGYQENGEARRVMTPWSEDDMPFEEAAEMGTKKVIAEHATVGIVMTCDGTITELPRSSYVDAEERVVGELKALGKPFIMVLNSQNPDDAECQTLAGALREKYGIAVVPMNVANMTRAEAEGLLSEVLLEFPLREIRLALPAWAQALPADHWLPAEIIEAMRAPAGDIACMRQAEAMLPSIQECESVTDAHVDTMDLSRGVVTLDVSLREGLYYQLLSEACGVEVRGDFHLLQLLREFAEAKHAYDRYNAAIESALNTGYGMVSPGLSEMALDEPQIVRQGGRFGVKLKASAPSLHLLRVAVESEVSPILGTEKQSEEMLQYMLDEFENDPQKLWETNFFGRSLHDMVKESLSDKLMRMPEDVQHKMTAALTRIINEGSGGMICILL